MAYLALFFAASISSFAPRCAAVNVRFLAVGAVGTGVAAACEFFGGREASRGLARFYSSDQAITILNQEGDNLISRHHWQRSTGSQVSSCYSIVWLLQHRNHE